MEVWSLSGIFGSKFDLSRWSQHRYRNVGTRIWNFCSSTQLGSPKYTGKIPGCVLSLRTYFPRRQTASEILAGGHFVVAVIVTSVQGQSALPAKQTKKKSLSLSPIVNGVIIIEI